MDNPIPEIILIVVLLILNGIFSAGEIAIVSSRKSKIRELMKSGENKRAQALFEMKENPERFLSAVQIGITLFGTLASAVGGVLAVHYIEHTINIDEGKDKVLEYIISNEFSRYPVYKDYPDNIVGIVYHKDITRQMWHNETFSLEKLLKKPFFVPDTMEISHLLKEMQKKRTHMAIVADEYGATVGIVTLEDIMEEIFGEIMDETDVDDLIERQKDGTIIIDGSYSIRDLNSKLQLNLEESPDYETLGGFILTKLQGMARGGEVIYHGPYRFTIGDVEGLRISKVKLERTKTPPKTR